MNIKTTLGRAIVLVDDYDKAFRFYQRNFFCRKIFDQTMADGQRFLHIGFNSKQDLGIWFLKADGDEQRKKIGNQTAGQPTLVVYTDDIKGLYDHVQKNAVRIVEELVADEGAKFFHCLDLYGNKITVVELHKIK